MRHISLRASQQWPLVEWTIMVQVAAWCDTWRSVRGSLFGCVAWTLVLQLWMNWMVYAVTRLYRLKDENLSTGMRESSITARVQVVVIFNSSAADELNLATSYWYSIIQRTHLPGELRILTTKSQKIPTSSKIYSLNPFVDDQGMLRVSGRQQKARFSYNSRHPIILDSRHPLTNLLLIHSEHICLLHGGSLLVSSSLFRNFQTDPDLLKVDF